MNSFADAQRLYDLMLPEDEEPEEVGNPAAEIREAMQGSICDRIPFINHKSEREDSCPASEAVLEALGDLPEMQSALAELLDGNQEAAKRMRDLAADYWIKQQADDLLAYRRGTLFDWQTEDL